MNSFSPSYGQVHVQCAQVSPSTESIDGAPIWPRLSFEALRQSYRGHGGLARAEDLVELLEDRGRCDVVGLAKMLVGRTVFSLQWQDAFWVPMFQLERRDLTVRDGVHRIVATLGQPPDGWAIASWFVQPHPVLDGRRPVEMLDGHWHAVLRAARVQALRA